MLPCITRASSGLSVLIPTLPAWYTLSGAAPLCHPPSAPTPVPSDSNCPGLLAYNATHDNIENLNSDFRTMPPLIPLLIDTYSDNYTFRCVSHYLITGLVCGMSVQSDNQMKIPLVRIWFAFFTHIIARSFAKVQAADRHFCYTFAA